MHRSKKKMAKRLFSLLAKSKMAGKGALHVMFALRNNEKNLPRVTNIGLCNEQLFS